MKSNLSKEIVRYKCWKDFNNYLEGLTKNDKSKLAGDFFELITKHFLQSNYKYKSILKNVWLLGEVPEQIKIKLNIPKSDEGIDLIAETFDGKYWSIQSKYRSNPDENLTLGGQGGLATFNSLSFTYCKNIDHGLVLTTVNKKPKKIRLTNNIGFETLESFLSLDDNQFEGWKLILNNIQNNFSKPKHLSPRPHQLEAITFATEYFKKNDRGKIIMPCGTGKSLLSFWIFRELKFDSVLITVPSLSLLHQTLKLWTKELFLNNIPAEWICICSDSSVTDSQDSFVSFSYDLGIKVTTNKDDIKSFLNKRSQKKKIIFATYQSGKVLAEGAKDFVIDLAIMDEAHKTVGHKEKLYAHLINEKNIRIKKRLFMTATERLFRANHNEYLSMNSIKDYGKIIYELSFKKAIESLPPLISDYRFITLNVLDKDIDKLHKDNKFIKIKDKIKDITAREFATAVALRKTIRDLKINNALSFHSSIKRAKNFQKQQELIDEVYDDFEKLNTYHVSGDMSSSKRVSQMRLFAEQKGLMTNARCLTEGVDLPAIDCVCFTDPKRSKVDIVQAAGRALRLSQETKKKFAYILVPLYIPDDLDPQIAVRDTAFEEIVTVIAALSIQDSRIKDFLKSVTVGSKPSVGKKVDGLISINILESVDSEKFKNAIFIKVWDKIARVNFCTYEEAKKYAISRKIKSMREYYKIARQKNFPKDIPKKPPDFYTDIWKSWGEFLGTGVVTSNRDRGGIEWREFSKAKEFARQKKFKTSREWIKFVRKTEDLPLDIPKKPSDVYKADWKDWADFLGSEHTTVHKDRNRGVNWASYSEVQKYIKDLNLSSSREYFKYARDKKNNFPKNFPIKPHEAYERTKEWKGWGIFLGTGTKYHNRFRAKNIKWRTYVEAKKFLKNYKVNSKREFINKARADKNFPNDIPFKPDSVYKEEFEGWTIYLNSKK